MALSVFANIKNWAGGILSPASTASSAAPVIPDVRNTGAKYSSLLINQLTISGSVYATQWFDTNVTGTQYIAAQMLVGGSSANGFQIQETSDPAGATANVVSVFLGTLAAGGAGYGSVRLRYWRLVVTSGLTGQMVVSVSEFRTAANFQNFFSSVPGLPTLTQGNAGSIGADAQVAVSLGGLTATGGQLCTQQYIATGVASGAGTNNVAVRTPGFYRGSQFSGAGQNVVWSPNLGKKIRLMKYKIEVSEDATISTGPLPINLAFSESLVAANTGIMVAGTFNPAYTHRFVAPNAVLATSGSLYDSGWIDLGNGQLTGNASDQLTMGIMVPQPVGAVTPTFTIPSNQWEAATVAFKTNNNLGNFKLIQRQGNTSASSAASIALPATSHAAGNSVFVFIRYTKVVGGAAVITVTDTAGNSYTVTTQVANASDGANGSAICVAYATNIVGNAANVITVTYGTNNAAASSVTSLEYAGMGTGGIDAVQVGTTGNSTSASSGAYTTATAGTLLFSFYGTSANIAALPTVNSNLRLITSPNGLISGSVGVADNFGNGALATGQINIIAIGTEE